MASRLVMAVAFASLLVTPFPVAAQEDGPVYIVEEGDTLIGIATRFGTTVEDLAAANGLADPSAIFPGMRLVLPGFEGISGVLETRPVDLGENLVSLGLKHHTPPESLARLNRIANPSRLYVGQPFIVPVEQGEDQPLNVTLVQPPPGTSALEMAVQVGANPWILDGLNGASSRLWLSADEPLFVPGGDELPRALPASIGSVSIEPEQPGQGHTAILSADLFEDGTLAGNLGNRQLNFEPEPEDSLKRVALQGIHALAEPGLVDLTLTYTPSGEGAPFTFMQPVRIREEDYPREALTVPTETLDPANTVPEDQQVAALLAPVTPEKMWDGPFLFPADYHETFPSQFGSRRNYNGTGWNSYHTGLDLYGSTDTEIHAPAPGVVVFAGPLTVRGNTTYIDHGWGVYSGYFHQSEIFVQPGDPVEPGDLIGMVGGTGRVTGAHLHWEIWVGGVPVQPLDWTETSLP
ncbi:MAG TPA: peptidoglycan DD-metalloendopeptidase family protein [Anaerolineales bacterium]|nr:peptidoglycan DD-metalloendopeptidase family protein [Anaerolineales bacterium]